ncbi:MAG: hypothetical protein IJU71_02940 [Selenomonadaceae bacterium]|nr:hypothetical protein [Selenomonadaceae bacterium]
MNGILDELMSSTAIVRGQRFLSNSFCFDEELNVETTIEDGTKDGWLACAETDCSKAPRDLSRWLSKLSSMPSCFRYFLDGSRRVFKLDDVEFDGKIYPIAAGQIGIGCCRREGRELAKEFFERGLVVVLPNCALKHQRAYLRAELLKDINAASTLTRHRLTIDKVLLYNLDADLSFEAKAIAAVQNYMLERERLAVMKLIEQRKLRKGAYLIKDGSIEYRADDYHAGDKFNWVLGVAKTFNASRCYVRLDRNRLYVDPMLVARLNRFERTNAYRYPMRVSDREINFCVWYVRLHENRFARNAFDGVLKVEKLMTPSEVKAGVDSERIDLISAHLMRERNPVCYGADRRWADHIYPMFVTEQLAKSNYISDRLFLKLF